MSDALRWNEDGRDWPNREHSAFVRAADLRWHVQSWGEGPVVLLLHGTGASTHSWRDLGPLLARRFTVVAPDLPGHGFTELPPSRRLGLPAMAADIAGLLRALDRKPDLVVGHSAGAAILCRMVLDGLIAPKGVVSLNGALRGFRGLLAQTFSPLAKLLAANPFAPRVFSSMLSGPSSVRRLVEETGSSIDEKGIELYGRLVGSPSHVQGALGMMANWDLGVLERDLPRLPVPLLLVIGGRDRSVPPSDARHLRDIVPGSKVEERGSFGHLLHEERPGEAADIILAFARSVGALPAG